jgi:flagellar basal-body rod protein FlgG
MIPGLSAGLSGLLASQTQLEVSANNLANLNTPGFKAGSVVQEEAPPETVAGVQVGGGTEVAAITTNYSSGGIAQTGDPSDLSINGNGFFEVVAPNGETSFTRNGDFIPDSQGFLRTPAGAYLSAGGAAVKIPTNATGYTVASNGQVSASFANGTTQSVAQIDLATFNNDNGLANTGGGLLKPTEASGMPVYSAAGTNGAGTIEQGSLELSNVDVVNEMVSQIVALRSYQANAKMIQVANENSKTLLDLIA